MAKILRRMLIDATHSEETRVAVIDQYLRLEHLDIVHEGREPLKGNIYLAKVRRIEPSLQAAFVEYGGNRQGFLPFAEIHPDYFRIPIADREALMQKIAAAEERLLAKVESGAAVNKVLAEEGLAEMLPDIAPDADTDDVGAAAEAPDGAAALFATAGFNDPLSAQDIAEARAFDPLQPISLTDGAATDAGGLVHLVAPVADDTAASFAGPADATTRPDTNMADAGMPDAGMPDTGGNYETVGGSEDDIMELRLRIRRQFLRNYRIQEVIKRGQVMLIQVVKEERGNKGAALTTYLSLAGRYCVLMPNSDRSGGVSRKISNPGDRRRLKQIIDSLEVPTGMSCILRTAGVERTDEEIKRDFDYLVRLWDQIRDQTLQSTAPALIYEEANLIKRALRDYYSRDTDAVVVEGEEGFKLASDFMKLLMPTHAHRVINYTDSNVSLFTRYQIENQIEKLYQPVVQLKSGGYIVINPTEALVSIDVNSGRATRDRHIEETALRTNLEAAEEIARQLRLRDLAGLVVIDFIDMEDYRHNHQVERKLKEAMRHDRARLQIGRISPFGLLEMSRQRLRASLLETNYEKCPHCQGTGHVRSTDSAALSVLRAIADEGIKQKASELAVYVPTAIAIYILNHKRVVLEDLQRRYGLVVYLKNNDDLSVSEYKIERLTGRDGESVIKMPVFDPNRVFFDHAAELGLEPLSREELQELSGNPEIDSEEESNERRARRGRTGRGGRGRDRAERGTRRAFDGAPEQGSSMQSAAESEQEDMGGEAGDSTGEAAAASVTDGGDAAAGRDGRGDNRRRRRGRRGGRNRERGDRSDAPRHGNTRNDGGRTDAAAHNGVGPKGDGGHNIAPPVAAAGTGMGGRPASVFDLDTTPKPPAAEKAGEKTGDDQPAKAGWWRRWTS